MWIHVGGHHFGGMFRPAVGHHIDQIEVTHGSDHRQQHSRAECPLQVGQLETPENGRLAGTIQIGSFHNLPGEGGQGSKKQHHVKRHILPADNGNYRA